MKHGHVSSWIEESPVAGHLLLQWAVDTDLNGDTALHIAARRLSAKAVEWLLSLDETSPAGTLNRGQLSALGAALERYGRLMLGKKECVQDYEVLQNRLHKVVTLLLGAGADVRRLRHRDLRLVRRAVRKDLKLGLWQAERLRFTGRVAPSRTRSRVQE